MINIIKQFFDSAQF